MKFAAIFIAFILITGCARKPQYREAPVVSNEIVIDISSLNGETPVFFSFHHEGKRYDFFVQYINGETRAFVDACFKCAPKQRGFETEHGRLRCRACGEDFQLENLSGIGSCYPIPLNGERKAGNYLIKTEQLIAKSKYPL